MRLTFLIIILGLNTAVYCQDFMFRWQIWPPFNKGYTVFIERKDNMSLILINEDGSSRFLRKKLSQKDCDFLNTILDVYSFPNKANSYYGIKYREYQETKDLADSTWVLINGDSLRRDLAWAHGFYFDSDEGKYYTEVQKVNSCTDGILYEGEYFRNGLKKTFCVHSINLTQSDHKLNRLICDLLIKYNRSNNFEWLKELIDSDRPGE